MAEFTVRAIGYVSTSMSELKDDLWDGAAARIDLDERQFSADSLAGLDGFSHVEVLFLMDRVSAEEITSGARHPRERQDWPKVGIFAQRAKAGPNRIGATVCRLVGVERMSVTVQGLDAVDGTPVLDIKPYMREFGARGLVRQPAWATELMSGYWAARPEINLRLFAQTPAAIADFLLEATQDGLDWQPAPERFSITMVLAHLADVEIHTVMNRIRAVAEQENPVLPAYDQEALFRSGKTFRAREELERFAERRTETIGYLRLLPASAMQRTGRHEELGTVRLEEILNECMFHDLGHIRQVAELYRARAFYPRIGGFQRYYTVKP